MGKASKRCRAKSGDERCVLPAGHRGNHALPAMPFSMMPEIAKPARCKKRPKDWAIKAAEALWQDMRDRRGFGLEGLQADDWPMYIQIIRKHASLIRNAAKAAGGE